MNYQYSNIALLVNKTEPYGHVACYHVIGATIDSETDEPKYSIESLNEHGQIINTFTLDEFGLEELITKHNYPMYSSKAEALAIANKFQ